MRRSEYKTKNKLMNKDFFTPTALCWISRVYLIVAVLMHVVCIAVNLYTKMNWLALVGVVYIIAFATCFFLYTENRIRAIYTFVICIIGIYVLLYTIIFGFDYNFFKYSFMMIPLCILTCISPKEGKYNIKYAVMCFVISQGVLLMFRIIYYYMGMEPLVTLEGVYEKAYRLEGIIVYFTAAVASFVPVFGFIIDLNTAYQRIAQYSNQLKYTATHDALTNLINRHSIYEYLNEQHEKYNNQKKEYSVILADIDDFKKVNDTYGHNVGDEVLKAVANQILKTVQIADSVCRWGGEEILVVIPTNKKKTKEIAENIRKQIEKIKIETDKGDIGVTLTMGIAQIEEQITIEELIGKADTNLYIGKHQGKNCVIV